MKSFTRSQDGSTAIEFTLLFPIFIAVLFSAFEMGTLFLRFSQLDHAVDRVSRLMRINQGVSYSEPTIRKMLCQEIGIVRSCEDSMAVEVASLNSIAMSGARNSCSGTGKIVRTPGAFSAGKKSEVLLMRVCMSFEPLTPFLGIALNLAPEGNNRYVAVSSTLFANEP